MARWAPRLAVAAVVLGTASPIIEWVGREVSTQQLRSAQQNPQPARSRANPTAFNGPEPWYANNGMVMVFWLAPLKAGVLGAAWAYVLVARARLAHGAEVDAGRVRRPSRL